MPKPLDERSMRAAIAALDDEIDAHAHLVVGGGAAMILAFGHPLATQDVDAFAGRDGMSIDDLDAAAKTIAKKLDISNDWLNGHFTTFTHVLPSDYQTRVRKVFEGQHLIVDALGPEDLLIMKCFAGRDKDRPHVSKLLRVAQDLDLVDRHLQHLIDRNVPGAERAADYFDDMRDEAGV